MDVEAYLVEDPARSAAGADRLGDPACVEDRHRIYGSEGKL
jgi:hypothetical protein